MIKSEYSAITEFKNKLKSTDIKIWIYKLPIKDVKEKHKENYIVANYLKNLNKKNLMIEFNENIIASFNELKSWGELKYISVEHRTINNNIIAEKRILERLLLSDIRSNINKNIYEIRNKEKSNIYIKEPLLIKDNVILKRKIKFDINIDDKGNIIIGFNLSHSYDYINTLDKDLDKLEKGDKVKDFHNNIYYKFLEIANFTINDDNEYLKCSIIDYYKNKKQFYIVENINPNMKAVLVSDENNNVFPYIPSRLKRVCDYSNLPGYIFNQCNNYTKLNSNEKMKISIDITKDILKNSKYISFDKRNMLIENLGYEKYILNKPNLIFGDKKIHNNILYGLCENGCYENKEVEIIYFIDPTIIKDKNSFVKIKLFTEELEIYSESIGIKLKRMNSNIDFKSININNKDVFECNIRKIVGSYKNPTIIILRDENCEKYYNSIKKVFGNKENIATQFIKLSTLNYNEKNKNAIFLNILLGIYSKSGIQPWILEKKLSADCYIGLDISRENKNNNIGIVQIVGSDGRILNTKSVTSFQYGEKIKLDTMKELFYESIASYEKNYKKPLKHLVIHRDGINREELEFLKETSKNLGIKFEYIEITKNVNRRMAIFNTSNNLWQTIMGLYYIKDDFAYMITTNPYYKIGMAQPIRIKKIYGEQPLNEIIEDVYKLSFMHIGSLLKPRLPITTYYADLISTYGNRNLIPSNLDSNILHFI